MNMLEVGKIVNTHGLRGEVKVVPWTDYPEVFEDIKTVFTADGKEFNIKGIKYQKSNIILRFAEITDIDEAEKLKGKTVFAERNALGELPEGVYYVADLIGLKVITDEGEELGEISDVLQTGANDIYEVKREGKKALLIPVIESVVLKVDTDARTVTVHLMEGLLNL
ncbi:MAG: 16S rRNA processing protein RimM [Clostridia bacterium]|nr:16S rRNA processing protein RimM [Clostridia bacterium]